MLSAGLLAKTLNRPEVSRFNGPLCVPHSVYQLSKIQKAELRFSHFFLPQQSKHQRPLRDGTVALRRFVVLVVGPVFFGSRSLDGWLKKIFQIRKTFD